MKLNPYSCTSGKTKMAWAYISNKDLLPLLILNKLNLTLDYTEHDTKKIKSNTTKELGTKTL